MPLLPSAPATPAPPEPPRAGDSQPVLLALRHWRPPLKVPQRPDSHPWEELGVVLRGLYRADVNGAMLTAPAGQVVWYASGVQHHPQPYQVETELAFIQWRQEPGSGPPRRLLVADLHGRVQLVTRWMLELRPPVREEQRVALEALFRALLYEHAQLSGVQEDALTARARAFIMSQLGQSMRVADVAKVCCMSKFHFARVFKRVTGETPMQCVQRLRVEAAETLLASTRLPHKAIARQVGLRSEAHLYRVYRRVRGGKPSEVRRRAGEPPPSS
jgi:AraC-like DNA-binding protein